MTEETRLRGALDAVADELGRVAASYRHGLECQPLVGQTERIRGLEGAAADLLRQLDEIERFARYAALTRCD
jgi:hypothetical protein